MSGKAVAQANLKAENSAELLSYVINQTPILSENIDLPVQGESIKPIGKIIMGNVAYKNAFLNTFNWFNSYNKEPLGKSMENIYR